MTDESAWAVHSAVDTAIVMAIGELKGQMTALSDIVSRKVQSTDELAKAVTRLESLPEDIQGLKDSMSSMDARLRNIEEADVGRNARQDLVAKLLASPALGWLVGALTIVGGVASGHLQIGVE